MNGAADTPASIALPRRSSCTPSPRQIRLLHEMSSTKKKKNKEE
jgi:hypothetical protein